MLSQPSATHIVCFESLYGSDMIYKKSPWNEVIWGQKVTKSGSYLKIAVVSICNIILWPHHIKYTKTWLNTISEYAAKIF